MVVCSTESFWWGTWYNHYKWQGRVIAMISPKWKAHILIWRHRSVKIFECNSSLEMIGNCLFVPLHSWSWQNGRKERETKEEAKGKNGKGICREAQISPLPETLAAFCCHRTVITLLSDNVGCADLVLLHSFMHLPPCCKLS